MDDALLQWILSDRARRNPAVIPAFLAANPNTNKSDLIAVMGN